METTTTTAVTQDTPPELLSPADMRALRLHLGVSRQALVQITGLTLSRVWAAEQEDKKVDDAQRMQLTQALREIEANGLPESIVKPAKQPKAKQPTRAELAMRLAQVAGLLDEAAEVKTLKEVRALVDRARAVAGRAAGDAPSEDDQAGTVAA